MRVSNDLMANATSGATDFETEAYSVEHLVLAAIQAQWTGDLAGTLQVQASCDVASPENWDNLTDKSLTAAGSASNGMIHLADMGYKWLRLTWTASTGTGTVTARFHGKGA